MKRLLLAAALVLAAGCGDEPSERPRPAQPADWSSRAGGWSELASPPFVRARAASVWMGRELFYWGGDTEFGGVAHADGAVFDPEAEAWRPTAPAPIGPRSSPGAVWTGSEVLVWGGWAGDGAGEWRADGAAYDPTANTWRPLPESPLSGRIPVAAVWTGTELIVWGDVSRSAEDVDGAAYDPARDSWRKLRPAPFALNEAEAVWTGAEMVVYGALLDGNNASRSEHARGVAYNPATDTWREIAPYRLSPQASAVVWTGREMIAWDYELEAGAYEPASDIWRDLPDLPLDFYECYPRGAFGDGVVLAWHCGLAAVLDLRQDAWRVPVTPRASVAGQPVSAGPVFLFAGATHESQANGLWAYRPGGDTSFVPADAEEGERIRLPLVFPDGTRIVLSYPLELDLASLGVQPDVSYLYRDDPAARFILTFVHGPADAGPLEIALHAGSWTILAQVRDPAERELVESNLRVHETPDGFPVVEALAPLALSHEFGEGGGVMLALGDLVPAENTVSSLDPLIELAPTDCQLENVEIGGSYGAKCFGNLYVGVYGDRPFIEAVLEGLRVEES
jgi:hypothetical protein